jgi:hypothetical protein
MRARTKLRLSATALVALLFSIGCNPLTGAYFLLFGVEDKVPAEFPIAPEGKKTSHVLVLTALLDDSKPELVGVERQLSGAISKEIELACTANKERVKLTPPHKVEAFKAANPGWRTMSANEIGRLFDVDFVVDVSIRDMSLYERDSRKQLFRGRAAIALNVTDVMRSADEGPAFEKRLSLEYPKAQGPIPVDDERNLDQFRDLFVKRISQEVAWKLTAHVSTADVGRD